MTSKAGSSDSPAESPAQAARKARLAEELRANLQRRKAQARSRRTGEADQRPDGLAAASPAGGGKSGMRDDGKDES